MAGTLIWSGVGSFLGVILFFLVRLWIEKSHTRKKFIIEYLCASDLNQGQATESEGELMHHHGKRVTNPDDLNLFEIQYPIWEWTNDKVGKGSGASIIFGPYTTDFDEPGMYSATFVMRSVGLELPKDKLYDHIILELDVNASLPDFAMKPQGDLFNFYSQNKFARGYVRISHLAKKGWFDYTLKFYSDAKGIWEYRILPYDGSENRLNNLREISPDARIVFDKVIIHKIPKFQLPSV